MSASTPAGPPATPPPRTEAASGGGERAVDWARLAGLPEFRALHESRRRYEFGGTALITVALLVVFGLYGWAPDAMGEPVIGSITWALALGLALVVLTFAMAWTYTRKAREWDRMAAEVLESAEHAPEPTRRFAR